MTSVEQPDRYEQKLTEILNKLIDLSDVLDVEIPRDEGTAITLDTVSEWVTVINDAVDERLALEGLADRLGAVAP